MRHLKILLLCAACMLAITACEKDDDITPTISKNVNSNAMFSQPYVTRLEFPHLKGGIVVTHKTSDRYGVNYSYEWDTEKMSQRWSCYQMYSGFDGNAGRYSGNPQYPFDPDMPSQYYFDNTDLYWKSGYDHGHICPSADRQYSTEANKQTFYLTNMQPQRNKFNAGLWSVMETKVRKWAQAPTTDTLYVCKGGTIDNENDIIERIQDRLIVPKYFYMALLLKNKEGYRALAFWAEHLNEDHSKDNLSDYVITIDELEKRTGIDFFCNLPDDIEDKVEGSYALNAWGLQ